MNVLFLPLEKLSESCPQTNINLWWSMQSFYIGEISNEEAIYWKITWNVLQRKSTNIVMVYFHL